MISHKFQPFKTNISGISLPEKFTFPFYYEPHELSIIASTELQNYLETQTDFEHNFGLDATQKGLIIGKMFGVLVCQNEVGELGYLWAFSGKLADSNHHDKFVPTVYDMLDAKGFYKIGEENLNQITSEIESLKESENYKKVFKNLEKTKTEAFNDIQNQKNNIKVQKKLRDEIRKSNSFNEEELKEASKQEGILLKKMTQFWNYKIQDSQKEFDLINSKIETLKLERKQKSAALQQRLFAEYAFLNQFGILKSIGEIFEENPPAGAGECAAPKLLHYAFANKLKPIAMAEFWWGKSPNSEIRKHKQFYPACKSKCEPILMQHMLDGLDMEENPFENNPAAGKVISIVYNDDYLVLINKPAEFLSVPGKQIKDSVYQRVKDLYPKATGPLIVHRLDMSTSGIMILAKNEEVYKELQSQFIKRTIKKRYVALLDGVLQENEGFIDFPLRVDLDDRPRQLVCYEHGKTAKTKWQKIEVIDNKTKVYFYPITGRTHQLRVHASHELGLKTPILGDDLYGKKANRLHLHAEQLTFIHPISKEEMTFSVEAEF
ncbi:pseudouridine synthase [uncultured Flavobacterium sp.]|uniref:pseudouridine synthase n=1 Tax=uncultured Flavobacterium sp. TaxID=165435 RepID=UPI0030EC4CC2|tara:strand:- start:28290 stop:29933 length:1644 start_codon:yes stop_codon:yes gene_type:complete